MSTDRDVVKPLLRRELKSIGISNKQVSVTNQIGANCWGIYVTIKDPAVDVSAVRTIVDKHYVDCNRTVCGDPNGGGLLISLMESYR